VKLEVVVPEIQSYVSFMMELLAKVCVDSSGSGPAERVSLIHYLMRSDSFLQCGRGLGVLSQQLE
jgi:hypothetical protein